MFAKFFSIFLLLSRVTELEKQIQDLITVTSRLRNRLDDQVLKDVKFNVGDFVTAVHYPGNGQTKRIRGMITKIYTHDYDGEVMVNVKTGNNYTLINGISAIEPLKCEDLILSKNKK